MTIELIGTIKKHETTSTTKTVTFDSIPTDGDLILVSIPHGAGTGGSPAGTPPAGFVADISQHSNSRIASIWRKVASGEGSAAYTFTGCQAITSSAAIGMVFRATNGFAIPAEVVTGAAPASTPTTTTLDPAGSPSAASALQVCNFYLTTTQTAAPTIAYNGGSAVTVQGTATLFRTGFGYSILTEIPADTKATFTWDTAAAHTETHGIYAESTTGPFTAVQKAALLAQFDTKGLT